MMNKLRFYQILWINAVCRRYIVKLWCNGNGNFLWNFPCCNTFESHDIFHTCQSYLRKVLFIKHCKLVEIYTYNITQLSSSCTGEGAKKSSPRHLHDQEKVIWLLLKIIFSIFTSPPFLCCSVFVSSFIIVSWHSVRTVLHQSHFKLFVVVLYLTTSLPTSEIL